MFILHPQLSKDCIEVCQLSLSSVLLMNDSRFPWLIQVPRVNNIKENIDLSVEQQEMVFHESNLLCHTLRQCFNPDKLNVAALGNMVPQLHIHHIARFKSDAAWPQPVWGHSAAIPYTSEKLDNMLNLLRASLEIKE